MRTIRVEPDLPEAEREARLEPAVRVIRSGGLVIFPTDTLYALGADPRSPAAVDRLFAAKQRDSTQPIPLIAASRDQVVEWAGTMTPLADRLAARWWPGPLTLLIPVSAHLCPEVHRGTGKVAVRVPDHVTARTLAALAGHPLTSTSANISGAAPTGRADAVSAVLLEGADLLIDGGTLAGGPPSTIVDATGEAPTLIRAGAVPWERVLTFLH